jgi:hypothetical protein
MNNIRIENKLRRELKIFKELKRIELKEFILKHNINNIKQKYCKKQK